MQTLWSRVAQVRATCRCPQCLNAAHGVTRRATASATQRMPRYLYSSTLWYSGIFAAAATFDASRKERRKEQWDRVIAEVRQDLEQPIGVKQQMVEDVEVQNHVLNELEDDAERYLPFGDLLEDENSAKMDSTEAGMEALKPLDEEGSMDIFHLVDPTQPKPHNPVNTGADLREWDLPPQSIYAPEWAKQRADFLRWTPKKLATVQKCSEILQLQFIHSLQIRGLEVEAAAAVPDEYARFIRQSPESLRHESEIKFAELLEIKEADPQLSDYQPRHPGRSEVMCQYVQDSVGNFHDSLRYVNRSFFTLFKQESEGRMSRGALIAKLAYSLYICPAPPNNDTFNTLLIGLRHAGEDGLVRKVIQRMYESHMRNNEVSFITKLEHYIEHNDLSNFVLLIERMRGGHGGPMLARPSVRIATAEAAKKLRRLEFEGKNGPETKVIQLPTPTPIVFGAIISGVLKFSGFQAALSICEGMGKEGWGLCMAGLTPLLKDCAERGDWTSGLAIWRQIQALKFKSDGQGMVSEQIGMETFAAMLRLCTRCDQKTVFDSIWKQASTAWHGSMGQLVRLVKGEAETKRSDRARIRKRAAVTRAAPRQMRPDLSTADDPFAQQLDSYQQDDDTDAPRDNTPEERRTRLPPTVPAQSTEKHQGTAARPRESTALPQEQLLGMLPPSHELDDYEIRERPMSVSG